MQQRTSSESFDCDSPRRYRQAFPFRAHGETPRRKPHHRVALGALHWRSGCFAQYRDAQAPFLEYIEISKGRSVKTVENYDHYLSRFLEFSKIQTADAVTDEVIREFRSGSIASTVRVRIR